MHAQGLSPVEFRDRILQRFGVTLSLGTLKNWRSMGKGPKHVISLGRVKYPMSEILQWEKKHKPRRPRA